ncbi:MAG: hypothetical protein IJC15_06395, partial [Clostridia bacterium]|nr:hypothetical protein [Clostridia bacterium]
TSLFLVILVAFVFVVPSSAAVIPEETVTPCWNNISSVTVEITFPNGNGIAVVDVTRVYGVTTSISGTLSLYKLVNGQWVFMDSTSGSSTRALRLELYFDAVSGVTYKAVADITAYSNTEVETETLSDIETCP